MEDRIRNYRYAEQVRAARGEALHALVDLVVSHHVELLGLALTDSLACEELLAGLMNHLPQETLRVLEGEPVVRRWVIRGTQEVLGWVAARQPQWVIAEHKLPEIRYGRQKHWAITPKRVDLVFKRPDDVLVLGEIKTGRAGEDDLLRKMQRYALAHLVAEAERGIYHRKIALRILHLPYTAGEGGRILKVRRHTVTHGWARRWLARRDAAAVLPKEPWNLEAAA